MVPEHFQRRGPNERSAAQTYNPNHPALRRRCKVCGAGAGEPCGTESDGAFFVHIGRRGFWHRLGVAFDRASEDMGLEGY